MCFADVCQRESLTMHLLSEIIPKSPFSKAVRLKQSNFIGKTKPQYKPAAEWRAKGRNLVAIPSKRNH